MSLQANVQGLNWETKYKIRYWTVLSHPGPLENPVGYGDGTTNNDWI